MKRALALAFVLLLFCLLTQGGQAQEGSGQSGKLIGEGMELEWRISGAETGPRFFADRTWQANGNITSTTVQFMGVLRVSIPSGYATDASMGAYISLPWSEGKKEVKWAANFPEVCCRMSKPSISHRSPAGQGGAGLGVGRQGRRRLRLLGVTFQFAPMPAEKKPVADASPNEPYWAWVRTEPRWIVEYAKGPTGSVAIGRDGVALIKTIAPGEGDEPSSRSMSGLLRWKLPLWIRAGESASIQFSIDKVRFLADRRRHKGFIYGSGVGRHRLATGREFFEAARDLWARHQGGNRSIVGRAQPGADQRHGAAGDAGLRQGTGMEADVGWHDRRRRTGGRGRLQLRAAGGRRPKNAPPVAADPTDPTTPCAGKSATDRAAMLALGRQLYFESTYLWLDYSTAMGPRKLWWNWSDFKSKYHIEAISLTGETVAKWAMTGRGAAAAVLAAGLAGNAIEDGVASGLRSLDRALLGDQVMLGLGQIYAANAANWEVIDKLGTAEERRAQLEKLGAQLNGVDKSNALAPVVVTSRPMNIIGAAPAAT